MPIETLPLKGDQRAGDERMVSAPDGTAETYRGMAHFAGTGPQGFYCMACVHFEKRHHKTSGHLLPGSCAKFVQLMQRGTKPIRFSGSAKACKHFHHETGSLL